MTAKNEALAALQSDLAAKHAEAKKLMDEFKGKEMPGEQKERVDTLLDEIEGLQGDIKRHSRLGANAEFLKVPAGVTAAGAEWKEAIGDEPAYDGKAWREVSFKTLDGEEKTIRYNVPLAVEKPGYEKAYEAYLRKGAALLQHNYPSDFKTLSEGIDSAGGYLVPPDFNAQLIKKIATVATVRQFAMVAQTGRDLAQWPKITYTADDKYTSGIRVTWAGAETYDSTSHEVTDQVFGMYDVPVNEMNASQPISRRLVEDSDFDVMGISADLMAEAFALGENDAFWNGSGAGRPRGIITSAATTTDAADHIPQGALSATAETLTADELIDLVYALPAQYERNARMFFNKATEKAIRKLTSTDGNYLWPVWPQVGNLGVNPREILGFPTVRDEFVPNIPSTSEAADNYPVIFGDLMGYLVLDRVGISLEVIREKYIEQGYVKLFGRKRVGGQVIQPWRLRSYKVLSTT